MMDFMDNLRRGVDRAGFEVDKMLRMNRVRSGIGTIRSQIDEEYRQIGRDIMEMFNQRQPLPEQIRARCELVRRFEAEIAQRETELEIINSESPPDMVPGPLGTVATRCWKCGHPVSDGAKFCPECGTSLFTPHDGDQAPNQNTQPDRETRPAQAGPSDPVD